MKKLFLLLISIFLLYSCSSKKEYEKLYGYANYKVSLLNARGDTLETTYAHEKRDAWDYGMHKNYKFTYYIWKQGTFNKNYGNIMMAQWEWSKDRVVIQKGKYKIK